MTDFLLGNVDNRGRALDDLRWRGGHFLNHLSDGFRGSADITIDLAYGIVGFLHDLACDGHRRARHLYGYP